MDSLWKLGDEFRGRSKISEDHQWSFMTSKLAELTRSKFEQMNSMNFSRKVFEMKLSDKVGHWEDRTFEIINRGPVNLELRLNWASIKNRFHGTYNKNTVYQKGNTHNPDILKLNTGANMHVNKEDNSNSNNTTSAIDKQFKTLPSTEMLSRNETLGGYIFVCNNDTMQEDLRRKLFGLEHSLIIFLIILHIYIGLEYYLPLTRK